MVKGKFVLTAALAAASLSVFAGTSQAVVYVEAPDAGQTLATAQSTGPLAGQPLTSITGTISTSTDADLFKFTVAANGTAFSASTVGNSALDTALFLFSSTGTAILTNDDASGATFESTISTTLAAGSYYIGISLSGNEPVNSANQLLFAGYPSGDTTATRGAASGLNPTTEATFNGNTYYAETGPYGISLAGATTSAVPEPSTWAILGVTAAAGAFLRRRRTA